MEENGPVGPYILYDHVAAWARLSEAVTVYPCRHTIVVWPTLGGGFSDMEIDAFLKTLSKEVLDPDEYAGASGISRRFADLLPLVLDLESDSASPDADAFFRDRRSRELGALLLGVKPEDLTSTTQHEDFRRLLSRWRDWLQGQPLGGVVVGLLLAEAHTTRRNRRREKFEAIIAGALKSAVESRLDPKLQIRTNVGVSGVRTFDFLIFEENKAAVAVVATFQAATGGRQTESLRELPQLQRELQERGIALIVVADGPAVALVPGLAREMFPRLNFVTNIHGVRSGELNPLVAAALDRRAELQAESARVRDATLSRVAQGALSRGESVTSRVLGQSSDITSPFLIRFQAAHPEYALRPTPDGVVAEMANEIKRVRTAFAEVRAGSQAVADVIIDCLRIRLGLHGETKSVATVGALGRLSGLEFPIKLTAPLPMLLPTAPEALSNGETLAVLERAIIDAEVPGRLAVMIDPFQPMNSRAVSERLSVTRRLAVAVLDEEEVVDLLLRSQEEGREQFRRFLVRQADLTLVSPFVSEGPTSPRMFFGRERELRRIAEQIRDHSFALVGGRKAGKTSLLQRLKTFLAEDFRVFYLDCQAHPNREDFLNHLRSQLATEMSLPPGSLAPHAERILHAFADRFLPGFGVLLADEVDDLFLADAQAIEYPHVLSRALRSLAQSHRLSLVATGERALFTLTGDPSSPHWNFCTPLQIGPLEEVAARRLLREPLSALGVELHPDALSSALLTTARHPNLIQYLGTEFISVLSSRRSEDKSLQILKSDVERLSDTPQFRNRFLKTFWSQATGLEKLLSANLSLLEPRTIDELRKRLGPAAQTIRLSEVEKALSFLELYSIATPTNAGFVFSSSVFERYFSLVPESLKEQWKSELAKEAA